MTQEMLKKARELLKQKQYLQAALILEMLPDDALAQKWLAELQVRGLVSLPTSHQEDCSQQRSNTGDGSRGENGSISQVAAVTTPHKWEYITFKTINEHVQYPPVGGKNGDFLNSYLNYIGEQGWELVGYSAIPDPGLGNPDMLFIAKRIISDKSHE